MSGDFARPELNALLAAARSSSLPAARQLVERYQHDLLSTAYLLAGDPARARDLAGRAFLRFFEDIQALDPDDDPFPHLAGRLVLTLLTPEADTQASALPQLPASSAEMERFSVDDEHSRLQHALNMLEPHERLALVLVDFNGLVPAALVAIPGGERDVTAISERLPAIRRRVAQVASLDDERSLPAALRALAVHAPRMTVWQEIEPGVEEAFARRRFRARSLTLGVVGGVALLILAMAGALVYGAVGHEDDDSSGAIPTALPTIPLASAATPTSAPRYTPVGDVSDRILYVAERSERAPIFGLYDPTSGENRLLPGRGLIGISPDGSTLLQLETRQEPDRLSAMLVASSSSTAEELWRTDVGPLAESGPNSVVFDMVVIEDIIYVASHDPDFRPNLLTIAQVRLSDGSLRDILGLNFGVLLSGPNVAVDLIGTLEPAEPTLTIVARNSFEDWIKVQRIELRRGTTPIDSPPVTGVDEVVGTRLLTPDGRAALTVPSGRLSPAPVISYLTFDTMSGGEIELPFDSETSAGMALIEYVLSHDGSRLHAIAPYAARVAVIDLERRQVERTIDLSGIEIPASVPTEIGLSRFRELYGPVSAAFSTDGRHLYALGPLRAPPGGPYAPVLWKIETATWAVVDEWAVDTELPVRSLHAGADDGILYLHLAASDEDGQRFVTIDVNDGEMTGSAPDLEGHQVIGTLADLYRQAYGRSPAVAGIAPRDNGEFSSIPVVDLAVDPERGPAGWDFDLRVTLRDPATGDILTGEPPSGVRAPAPLALTATFINGGERRIAVLGRSGPGVYTGRLTLDLPGSWGLTLSAGDPQADSWSVSRPNVVEVADSVTDSAGREYTLEVETDPSPPVAGRLLTLTVSFVPLNAGLVMPSSPIPSSLELSRSLPVSLDMTLPDGMLATLYRGGGTHYATFAHFTEPGVYFPTISYIDGHGEQVTVTVRLEVLPPG